jgi:DNA-binding beta-propeller fold protein YncE
MFRCANGLLGVQRGRQIVFESRLWLRRGLLASVMTAVLLGVCASGAWAAGPTAYVATYYDRSPPAVVPIDLHTNAPGAAISLGANPLALAIAPDGATAYVLGNNNTVTPIDLSTNTPGTPIPVGSVNNNESVAIAITPDGSTAYVTNGAVNSGSSSVTPVDLATDTPEPSIPFDGYPNEVAITPDGRTAYVTGSTGSGSGTLTPIDLSTNTPETPITLGTLPYAIAITPDGSTAYVSDIEDNTVTPIDLATNTPGTPIPIIGPVAIAITPDGSTAYVASYYGTVVPIDLATNTSGTPITIPSAARAIAITPNGLSAYVASSGTMQGQRSFGSGSVTPIDLATGTPGPSITVGSQLPAIAITPAFFGAPTATIIRPAGNGTYTVGQTVTTAFSCTDASDGPGISSCKDSNQSTTGAGTLDTASTGVRTYSVKATSKDGRTATASITYTVESANNPTTTTPTRTTPVSPPPAPASGTQISEISVTMKLVIWCRGHGCRYPSTALRFLLNHTATVRLALRTRAHGHWKQVATTKLKGHRGMNRHRIAGRWHGLLVPTGPVQILVQIRRGRHWTTSKNIGLTVRHTR